MCSLAMGGLLTSTIETWPRGKGVVIKKERFNRHLAARIGEPVPYWFAQVVGFASPPRFFSSPPEFGASLPSLGDMLRWSCCPRSSSEQWIFGDGQHEHRGDGSYTFEGDRFRAPPAHLCLGKKIADELGEDDPVSRFLSGFFGGVEIAGLTQCNIQLTCGGEGFWPRVRMLCRYLAIPSKRRVQTFQRTWKRTSPDRWQGSFLRTSSRS